VDLKPVNSWFGVKAYDKVISINPFDNNLSGTIPAEISELQFARINLHKNNLEGIIPTSIETLKNVRVPDLVLNVSYQV
jgi:hypothetical protein